MKQEYVLVLIVGLLLAAYVLEAIVQPLAIDLPTPYHYMTAENLVTYPFTTTVIIVRGIGVFLSPIWLLSFIPKKYPLKASISLVLAALTQLYVLQELATGNKILPLEWALAVALAGLALLPMVLFYFSKGALSKAHSKLTHEEEKEEQEESTDRNQE